jgi:hypothetical protein
MLWFVVAEVSVMGLCPHCCVKQRCSEAERVIIMMAGKHRDVSGKGRGQDVSFQGTPHILQPPSDVHTTSQQCHQNYESVNGPIHSRRQILMIRPLPKSPNFEHCCTGDHAFNIWVFEETLYIKPYQILTCPAFSIDWSISYFIFMISFIFWLHSYFQKYIHIFIYI